MEMETARRAGDLARVSELQYGKIPELEKQLLAAADEENDHLAWEFFAWRAVRMSNWNATWIAAPFGAGDWQLFDVGKDPGETKNLIADPKYKELVKKLYAELDQRIKEAHDGKVDKMPIDQGIKGELPDEDIR